MTDRTRLPTVTQVLRAAGCYPSFMPPQFYLDRGTAGHKAAELTELRVLDEPTVDERIRPFLEAHKRAQLELGLKELTPPFIEKRLKALGFCGKPDNAKWLQGWRTVIDWKMGDGKADPATRLQISAYRVLLAEYLNMPLRRFHGGSLHYRTDGRYQWNPYTEAELDDGWHTFSAALDILHDDGSERLAASRGIVHQWRKMNGRLEVKEYGRKVA